MGTGGSGDGQFGHPLAIAVDGSGNVYVADAQPGYTAQRIQKFTSTGIHYQMEPRTRQFALRSMGLV